jgi:hypothetical protein
LARNIGDKLVNAGVPVRCMYGGTEFAVPQYMIPRKGSPMDWNYVDFLGDVPMRFEEQGEGSGLYELVILVGVFFMLPF